MCDGESEEVVLRRQEYEWHTEPDGRDVAVGMRDIFYDDGVIFLSFTFRYQVNMSRGKVTKL